MQYGGDFGDIVKVSEHGGYGKHTSAHASHGALGTLCLGVHRQIQVLNDKTRAWRPERGLYRTDERCGAGEASLGKRLIHLFRQLHAANTLVMALDSCRFFALALGCWLFVELTRTQVGQQTEFFNSPFKAAQCNVKGFVFFYANRSH